MGMEQKAGAGGSWGSGWVGEQGGAEGSPSSPPSQTFYDSPLLCDADLTTERLRQPQISAASGSCALPTMEKVLSFLDSTTEAWLRLGHLPSAFADIYPKSIFLSAAGVLLLYLTYLLLKPFLPPPSNQAIRKVRRCGVW